MNPMPESANKTDRKDLVFFGIFGCFFWIWGLMLIVMICYDIAQNFRGQINAGHAKLIRGGEMQSVIPNMSVEQEARNMLERAGIENAQQMTSGDLVEIANLIHEQ